MQVWDPKEARWEREREAERRRRAEAEVAEQAAAAAAAQEAAVAAAMAAAQAAALKAAATAAEAAAPDGGAAGDAPALTASPASAAVEEAPAGGGEPEPKRRRRGAVDYEALNREVEAEAAARRAGAAAAGMAGGQQVGAVIIPAEAAAVVVRMEEPAAGPDAVPAEAAPGAAETLAGVLGAAQEALATVLEGGGVPAAEAPGAANVQPAEAVVAEAVPEVAEVAAQDAGPPQAVSAALGDKACPCLSCAGLHISLLALHPQSVLSGAAHVKARCEVRSCTAGKGRTQPAGAWRSSFIAARLPTHCVNSIEHVLLAGAWRSARHRDAARADRVRACCACC